MAILQKLFAIDDVVEAHAMEYIEPERY